MTKRNTSLEEETQKISEEILKRAEKIHPLVRFKQDNGILQHSMRGELYHVEQTNPYTPLILDDAKPIIPARDVVPFRTIPTIHDATGITQANILNQIKEYNLNRTVGYEILVHSKKIAGDKVIYSTILYAPKE